MIARRRSAAATALLAGFVLAGASCGKKDGDGGASNAVPGDSHAADGKPAARPVPQAPPRGPEHSVY